MEENNSNTHTPNRVMPQSKVLIIAVLTLVAVVTGYNYWSNQNLPTDMIQYVTPEEVGWSSEKLDLIKPLVEESAYSAIMVAYDGKIFYSYGEVSKNYNVRAIFSLCYGQLASPTYSYLTVGRGNREELLVEGFRLLKTDKQKKLVVYTCPTFCGVVLELRYRKDDSELALSFLKKAAKFFCKISYCQFNGERIKK